MKSSLPFKLTVGLLLVVSRTLLAAPTESWEKFSDGSLGRTTDFHGVGGADIAAYIRKPAGDGPFPVVLYLHGGGPSVENTYRFGRSTNGVVEEYLALGWAVYAIDFRTNGPGRAGPMDPNEYEDTVDGIKALRQMPFVDGKRVALTGASHGGHVLNRVVSRVDVSCAVLNSPTWIDSGQMKRGIEQEKNPAVVERLKLLTSFVDKLQDPAVRAAFDKASALDEAPQVRCPLLIIDGGEDISLPHWMVVEYMVKLHESGKTVDAFLPAAGEHGFAGGSTPEAKEARDRSLAFLKKYLAPTPASKP
jgi:dipeptidyl aminopeptidase/acylaminoacyl peptidase